MRFNIVLLGTLTLLAALGSAIYGSDSQMRGGQITHYRDSIAERFVALPPQWGDSVETIMLTVADLDTMGWRGLLPEELDDTCSIRRTSFVDMNAFGSYRITRLGGPGDWNGVPDRATIRAFIHDETDRPLFALTYPEYARARQVAPVSYKETCSLLTNLTPLEVVDAGCPDSLKPRGGVVAAISYWGKTDRSTVIYADLAVLHLVGVAAYGQLTCAWIMTTYGLKSIPGRAYIEEYDTRLEVAHAAQTFRYDDYTLVHWDGFPKHPENIKVMEDLKDWLVKYHQYREEWLKKPRTKRP
ncbi:hypothetical protein GF356_08290 [candidate division GN15 bacterium]|nr:hypothetical protein [candidate division GN15 bacterium]